uniref:Putative ribonuclease H-like domain-containing protein n=1 Tax=Tanacetum cinerariifolium TaxID=118510 RepID=A0A699H058_TANCI|nr:putative ribonuclease H-like domain-containing protein [Tanacetum cinerariifolium]
MLVPSTAEEKINKKNDVKARSLLLMALPNEHQLTFSQYNDAKSMFVAIETRFRESLDSIFNRIQKIISRFAILGVVITQEDLNSKFLRSLPLEWNTHVVVWMNKTDIETMSIDDLYNNFNIIEQDIKKSIGISTGAQNVAFMTAPSTSSTNDFNTANPAYKANTISSNVNTASPQVSTANFSDNAVYAFMVENPNGSNLLQKELEQIHVDDLEVMVLRWQFSLLSMREKRYFQMSGNKIFINANDTARYDKSKVECFNCNKMGHFARECRAQRNQDGRFKNQDNTRKQRNNEDISSKAMLAIDVAYKRGLATVEEQLVTYKKNEKTLNVDKEIAFSVDNKIEFVKPTNHDEQVKKSVRYAEMYRSQRPRENQRNWNEQKSNQLGSDFVMYNKACFICRSFGHVQINGTHHQRKRRVSGNNYNMVDSNYCAKTTHPSAQRNMPPRAVLLKTGLIPFNTARPVYTTYPKQTVHKKPQNDDKGFIDSGCSRHMTGNKAYLSDFKKFNRGYVIFGGGAHGGRISSKAVGTIIDESPGTQGDFNADCTHNEDDDKDKSEDDTCTKEVNAARQHVNTTSLEVNTGHFELNTIDPSLNTASSYYLHSPTDMFKFEASDSLKASHVEFFSNREAPEVYLRNIPNFYGVLTTSHTRIHKEHLIENVEAMQEELLQFKIQHVWILMDFPYGKKVTGTKWVFRIKKDKRGIVIRNKARLVTQGHRQEECIDYEDVFAHVARIEIIRLFLAYASYMGFLVYQMDVKSALLYGTIEGEVYVTQPLGFKDPNHPDKVYKVVKVLYGLHQAPRAWYDTLANYLLSNGFQRRKIDPTLFIKKQRGDILLVWIYVDDIIFGSTNKELCTAFEKLMKDKFQMNVKSASTLVDLEKPLVKDRDANDVDVHLYRSMIRYLKGKPTLGLWYPRDSPFKLVAYTDSDYAGATQDRKSTTGGC